MSQVEVLEKLMKLIEEQTKKIEELSKEIDEIKKNKVTTEKAIITSNLTEEEKIQALSKLPGMQAAIDRILKDWEAVKRRL